jgi:hypothetical protein
MLNGPVKELARLPPSADLKPRTAGLLGGHESGETEASAVVADVTAESQARDARNVTVAAASPSLRLFT